MKTSEKGSGLTSLIFFGIFLASLVIPLRSGLPAFRDALPSSSPGLANHPLLRIARDALFLPPEYEKRYEQHYQGRQARIELYNALLFHTLDVRSYANVLRGNDGWLVYTGEGNIDDYQNVHPFSPGELEEIRRELETAQEWMNIQGITFLVVVAPNKETIYPEAVPVDIRKIGKYSRLDQLTTYLQTQSSPVNLLDLRPVLLAHKPASLLYYKTDSHWNDTGAFYASAEILKAVDRGAFDAFPRIEDFEIETGEVSGDLARMLPMNPMIRETASWLHPGKGTQAHIIERTERVITISEVNNPDLPRAVIFRDSFTDQLEPFLSEAFSRAVYPWSFRVDRNLVEQEKPDVVIFEIAERYLDKLKYINK